jgi:FlaA1/EpsC-like NDP-sugar epimerase
MKINQNIESFISESVTKRPKSLLSSDFKMYVDDLFAKINGKSALIIGGAGTIGSFYIKALLKFKVAKLIVVDINENGLTELVRDLRSSSSGSEGFFPLTLIC